MNRALAFKPQLSWEVPIPCELFLPLTERSLLFGSRGTGELTTQDIMSKSDNDFQAYLRATANSYQMPELTLFQPGKSRLVAITLNTGRNRLYMLYLTTQPATNLPALALMRFGFDSHTQTIGDFYGELPLPLPESRPILEYPIDSWENFIEFLYTNPIEGGHKGQIVNRRDFDKYFFLYVHDEYVYVFYPIYHSSVLLHHVPALHQIMTVMHERTGQYLGSYLLPAPKGLEHQTQAEVLTLRTNVCLLDSQLIFCNEFVNTAQLGWPYIKAPTALTTPRLSVGYQKYYVPPKRFFTSISSADLGIGYVWTRPFSYARMLDIYAEEHQFSLLGEMEYEQIYVDKDQLKLYGVYEDKIQQYIIEYIEWYILDIDDTWRPASTLALPACYSGMQRPFRLGNRSTSTYLKNIQIRSKNADIQFSTNGTQYSSVVQIEDLAPQQQSGNYYLQYTGSLPFSTPFSEAVLEIAYSLYTSA